jgi:hypothetical protein
MEKRLVKKFKKFLESRSALFIYMKTYRERHLSINPDNWDDFLRQTTPELVIPGAFVYPSSNYSIYNRDFWLSLHETWMSLLENDKQTEEEHHLLADVDFFDVEKRLINGLGKDTASLNMRYTDRLTFNQEHTGLIVGSGLKLVALGQSRTSGDVLLMISNQRGITYNVAEHSKSAGGRNVVVGSKDFCQKLSRLLGIDDDYALLNCKMVANNINMILFTLNIKD